MTDASSSIPQFAKLLQKEWQDLDGENLADIFWLACQISPSPIAKSIASTTPDPDEVTVRTSNEIIAPPPPDLNPKVPIVLPPPPETQSPQSYSNSLPLQIPAANALRSRLALSRALRPLMQKMPSRTQTVLDEEATAIQTAEQNIWSPVMTPAAERWFDLTIAIEDSPSLKIWTETIAELIELVEQQGAFRQIRTWLLTPELNISPNWQAKTDKRSQQPKALKAPHGRQIIWVLSDCTSDLWQQPAIYDILQDWGKASPLVLVQLFPERLWSRTSLGDGRLMRMSAKYAGATQAKLSEEAKPIYPILADLDYQNSTTSTIILPAISIEPEPFRRWAKVTTGNLNASIVGIEINLAKLSSPSESAHELSRPTITSKAQIQERVQNFCRTASITAQRLATYMAAVPVSIPIVHLIQKTLLPESQQVHIAEVFMGGILETIPLSPQSPPQPPQYRFVQGVREALIAAVPISKTIRVLDTVSAYISDRLGKGVKSFQALIALLHELKPDERQQVERFAEIGLDTLSQLGSEHRAMAERLRQFIQNPPPPDPKGLPKMQPHTFQIAQIEIEELARFDFETAKIARDKKNSKNWQITKSAGYGWQRTEELGDVRLAMVEIIGGTFLMGAPKDEPEFYEDEAPQHEVTVSDFFISKYPITQAQWRAVATQLPQINIELNPDPSDFQGNENCPVEQVSWFEAVEFCDRLSVKTGREYRLPTEAEWEYACRAGTTTPFYFGETLSSKLANYNWDSNYNNGPKGGDRQTSQTSPVGNFPANAFGLYDMHGNVYEWCLDTWHGSYSEKPEELKKSGNIPWVSGDEKEERRLLRGGSWVTLPRHCRSAYRYYSRPGVRLSSIGFRIVSCLARTLP